jgi:CheY-like chemotaxis protein
VEDEPIVLMVAADSPEQAGLKVLEAEDAEAAVNILEV